VEAAIIVEKFNAATFNLVNFSCPGRRMNTLTFGPNYRARTATDGGPAPN
jgi:hypothetical protein